MASSPEEEVWMRLLYAMVHGGKAEMPTAMKYKSSPTNLCDETKKTQSVDTIDGATRKDTSKITKIDEIEKASGQNAGVLDLIDMKFLECPSCRRVFTDPRLLPCGDCTVCADCLAGYRDEHAAQCTDCRQFFETSHEKPAQENLFVASLIRLHTKYSDLGGGQLLQRAKMTHSV